MRLFIYCAGGLGKEVYDLSNWVNEKEKRWECISFIDDFSNESQHYGTNLYRFKEVIELSKIEDIEVTIATGEPYKREMIYERILNKKIPLATIIHPDATISPTVKLGRGAIIHKNVYLSSDVVLGDNILLQSSVIIGHDTKAASHSVISSFVFLGGNSQLGKRVYIAPSAVVKDKIMIGNDSIVGMGSIIIKNVQPGSIMFGNPACKIGENTEHRVFH